MADQIVELLKNNKLRAKVVQAINDVYNYAGTLHDNPTDDMEEDLERFGEESRWEEAWWRAETFGEVERIKKAFRQDVFEKLSKPRRISFEEIVEAFLSLAKPGEYSWPGLESEDFDNTYEIFINYVNNHILSYRRSTPFPICLVPDDGKDYEWEDTLWSKNGVRLHLLGRSYFKRIHGGKLFHLLAAVDGHMSNAACEWLQAEIGRTLPSVIRSVALLDPVKNTNRGPQHIEELPLASEPLLQRKKVLIQRSLDAYYSEPTKKDSIDRRIRNAVHLLIESDEQSNDAVGLALSIVAVDALLGEKGTEMTEKLADNVAVLLEPKLSKRNNTTKFVKDLCNLRSRALHGEKIEAESYTREQARHLAAGVLIGMISRRDFLHRLGNNPEGPQELLQGLREMRFDPGQPMGVDESNVRELWRS